MHYYMVTFTLPYELKGRYLFNGRALAAVFRGAFLKALHEAGLGAHITPKRWVAHCERAGPGRRDHFCEVCHP